jgi:putative transcriptional regulator
MRVPSIALTVLICSSAVVVTTAVIDNAITPRGTVVIEDPVLMLDAVDSVFPSLQGKMLVAAPDMDDPYFAGTRIYMLMHDEHGAVGVVVNRDFAWRPNGLVLGDGGPVGRQQVIVLHDDARRASFSVEPRVYLASDPDVLDNLPFRSRIFVGYAGWGAGQLERELRMGAWHVEEANDIDLFGPRLPQAIPMIY